MTARVVAFQVQSGTSGCSVAQTVAARIGYSYHEEDILVRAASLAGVSNEAMLDAASRPGFFSRLAEVLQAGSGHELQSEFEETRAAEGRGWLMSGRNRSFLEKVMTEIADGGQCVMVGHAGYIVLKDACPGVFRVLIRGSLEDRAAHYAKGNDGNLLEARRELLAKDRREANYLKHVYRVDVRDPELYDLSISTDGLDDSVAADLIVASVRNASEHRDHQHSGTVVAAGITATTNSFSHEEWAFQISQRCSRRVG